MFRPVIRVLNWVGNLGVRAFGVEPRDELTSAHTADELAVMLAASRQGGMIEDFAADLMAGVLDFGGLTAADVMVPRASISFVEQTTTVAEAENAVVERGHSRLPVVGRDLDDVRGFIHAKDLLTLAPTVADDPIPTRLTRRMLVVPEHRSLEDLLLMMRRTRVHFALVTASRSDAAGDHGRTAGVVTLEDLLEELVGDILDESDRERTARHPGPASAGDPGRRIPRFPRTHISNLRPRSNSINRGLLGSAAVRSRFTLSLVVVAGLMGLALPADAETTPSLDDARRRANEAAGRVQKLEAELGGLDGELTRLETERRSAEAELERLRAQVQRVAIDRYTHAGDDNPILVASDLNEGERAKVLVQIVTQGDHDAVDRYAATKDRLARTTEEVERRRARPSQATRRARTRREAIGRRARPARTTRGAAPRGRASRRGGGRPSSQRRGVPTARRHNFVRSRMHRPQAKPGEGRPSSAAPRQVASGEWVCPVQGPHTFRDSWGDARSGGRAHKGTDIMAPRGTPVVNPVSGNVTTKGDSLGGLSFHVQGDDGNYYYGTHLDSYSGATGHLPAGTVVGYVGDTGNAQGTHLHFEIHIGGYGNPINPYPTVARYC